MQKRDRQRSIRLPAEVDDAIQAMADDDGRSFSSMVERALRFFLEKSPKAKAKK
ncbi:MAG TPA: CopG family transcriptional regulator [Planctomycetes bacterium]|nr:CopG family transcriptional regulator [Planctomycetota bacterium]